MTCRTARNQKIVYPMDDDPKPFVRLPSRLKPAPPDRHPARSWLLWIAIVFAVAIGLAVDLRPSRGHEWYPADCCSGSDCRPIGHADVETTSVGWYVPESGEVIPYDDKRIRVTPPEGGGLVHRCSVGGRPAGATLCIYLPPQGN